jgi:hypothetical protein
MWSNDNAADSARSVFVPFFDDNRMDCDDVAEAARAAWNAAQGSGISIDGASTAADDDDEEEEDEDGGIDADVEDDDDGAGDDFDFSSDAMRAVGVSEPRETRLWRANAAGDRAAASFAPPPPACRCSGGDACFPPTFTLIRDRAVCILFCIAIDARRRMSRSLSMRLGCFLCIVVVVVAMASVVGGARRDDDDESLFS